MKENTMPRQAGTDYITKLSVKFLQAKLCNLALPLQYLPTKKKDIHLNKDPFHLSCD